MLNITGLKRKPSAITLTRVAVTIGILVGKWQVEKRRTAIMTEREQFAELISSLPDSSVSKFLAEYELLAAFDGLNRFNWKRDLCRKELANR